MNTGDDARYMARAIALAKRGWYTVRPNPRVGCVIVRDGAVVGEGWHQRAGEAHAEVNALAQAGGCARGATVYVSLEPCNHHGRTPPCAEALIEAGITRLVYGLADPHGLASGGARRLRQAGIGVEGPLLETDAIALNAGFVKRCRSGLPRVTLKLAASLDGRSAMASGESQWITGPAARSDVQRLRASHGAIVTGIGTVLQDDPAMTVRAEQLGLENSDEIAALQPMRVIVDSQLRIRPGLQILQGPGRVEVACAVTADQPEGIDAPLHSLPNADGKVDLRALLALLGERECNDVLVEAGAKLAGAFLRERLVDEIICYFAPKLLGSRAMPMLELPFDTMAQALDLKIEEVCAVGGDWRVRARPVYLNENT